MPAELGDTTGPGDNTKTFEDGAGEDLTAGDAAAIDQSDGNVYLADSNDANRGEFAGIVSETAASGETVVLYLGAPTGVTANVATGVSAGERLGVPDSSLAGENAGQLVASAGGLVLALSDEGGTTADGRGLDANEGEVAY